MAKNWDVELRDLYARGEVKSFRLLLAVIDKTPFSFAINTTPKRFNTLIECPEQFMISDVKKIAAFLKGGAKKITDADENFVMKLVQEYEREMRPRSQTDK